MKKKEEQQGKKQVKYEKEFAVFQVDKTSITSSIKMVIQQSIWM